MIFRLKRFRYASFSLLCLSLVLGWRANAATPRWQDPTPEELKMTAQPEVPGAAAVILLHEETVDDPHHVWTVYARIKILSEGGRDHYSNISIDYHAHTASDDIDIVDIAGRTIHPDGTIIPFAGGTYDHLVHHSSSSTTLEKVFTLPQVQVGSIIEYRYTLQFTPNALTYGLVSGGSFIPTWYMQSELFARKEHFLWHTSERPIGVTSTLPGGAAAVKTEEIKTARNEFNYTVDITNVMPLADEPFMPPAHSLEEKVVFYKLRSDSVSSAQEFWKEAGKSWSREVDDFIGSPAKLARPVAEITAGANTPEDKIRKIYAAVQAMRNTNFAREHSSREQKAAGLSPLKSASDVLEQKRGDDLQLSYLFVGLARAAGFKAYIMAVANRDIGIFDPQLLTFAQLNDDIAIVELDGKDHFFDPAEPFCTFGQLYWPHSDTAGLRQTAAGTTLATSPAGSLKDAETRRSANLQIDAAGQESGSIDLSFAGPQALYWRQQTLTGDETSLHKNLEDYLKARLPTGTDISLQSIDNLTNADLPLVVHLDISGPFARMTSKSSFFPEQIFQNGQQPLFTQAARTLPVYFSFPEHILDTVRLQLPSDWTLETAVQPETDTIPRMAGYNARAQLTGNVFVAHRDYILGTTIFEPTMYSTLRDFFSKIAIKDQELAAFHKNRAS